MKKERKVMPLQNGTAKYHTRPVLSPCADNVALLGHLSQLWRALCAGGRHRFCLQWTLIITQSVIIMLLVWQDCSSPPHSGRIEYKNYVNTIQDGADTAVASTGVKFNRWGQVDMTSLAKMLKDLPDTAYEVSKTLNVAEKPKRIFYNRVPKCGSSTLLDLMIEMSKIHNFTFTRAKEYMRFFLDDEWQETLAIRVKDYPTPSLYERHFHFMDFTRFNLEQPVYINLIRDPLERLVSWYYFRRFQDGHVRRMETAKRIRTFDECVLQNHAECMQPMGNNSEEGYFKLIPFFCGQDDFCRHPTEEALVQAIRNVKRHYVVVGVMEQYNKYVEALEYVLPSYFKGSTKLYDVLEKEWSSRHKTTYKLPVSSEVKTRMKSKLKLEYQFYMFVRQRFYDLLQDIETAKRKVLART